MKKFAIVIIAASAAVMSLSSCAGTYQKGDRMPETTTAQIDTISYALGMYYGKMVISSPFGTQNLNQMKKVFMYVLNETATILKAQVLVSLIPIDLRDRSA